MINVDKRTCMDDFSREAEEVATCREQGQLYKMAKVVNGTYCRYMDTPIIDKLRRTLATDVEQVAQWVVHHDEVLKRPLSTAEADI